MKYTVIEALRSIYTLLRFVFWYALGIAFLLYVLPHAAVFLQTEYESLNAAVRMSILVATAVLIVAGLINAIRQRNLSSPLVRNRPHSHS